MTLDTPYFGELRAKIMGLGGMFNAHLHLDRAGTIDYAAQPKSITPVDSPSHISLAAKHRLIPSVHASPAYDPDNLTARANYYLDQMAASGANRADTLVDVTADRVGLSALQAFLKIKQQRSPGFTFGLGAYSPLGFKDSEPERWELLVQGADLADFIGALPERDDQRDYPEHIGFSENCERMLLLGQQLNKAVHIHVDQRNEPSENGTEKVLKAIGKVGVAKSASGEPMVWLVHVISPSTYDEARFDQLVEGLVNNNVGVICCPSAALSMRQFRPLKTPTFNSIARVLEFLGAGVHVCIGSDNICDINSPMGTPDLMAELFVLANAIRFYDVDILASVAAGRRLNERQRQTVSNHLKMESAEIDAAAKRYAHGTD